MISTILSVLRFWKLGGAVLLILIFLTFFYLANARGQERDRYRQELKELTIKYQQDQKGWTDRLARLQNIHIEEAKRRDFDKLQQSSFRRATPVPLSLDPELHSAYERLRKRQSRASKAK